MPACLAVLAALRVLAGLRPKLVPRLRPKLVPRLRPKLVPRLVHSQRPRLRPRCDFSGSVARIWCPNIPGWEEIVTQEALEFPDGNTKSHSEIPDGNITPL